MEKCELCRAAARRLRESISSIYLGGYRHLNINKKKSGDFNFILSVSS